MNDLAQNVPAGAPAPQTFRHHPIAFWRPLTAVALLALAGIGGILVWAPLGLALWLGALMVAGAVYVHWRWHSFTFIDGNRLVRRYGFLGCAQNIITLFGVISPYQNPFLGRRLDVGSVHLGIPGPDIHIHHIASFRNFYGLLVNGAERQQQPQQLEQPSVQVFILMPSEPNRWQVRRQELQVVEPDYG